MQNHGKQAPRLSRIGLCKGRKVLRRRDVVFVKAASLLQQDGRTAVDRTGVRQDSKRRNILERTLQMNIRALIVLGAVLPACLGFCQGFDIPQTKMVAVDQSTTTGFSDKQAVKRSWLLTQPKSHHLAVVRVSVAGGAGTGCMIRHDGEGVFVITNHHVVSVGWTGNGFASRTHPTAKIEGAAGTVVGSVVFADQAKDIAIIYASNATSKHTIPLSSAMPAIGGAIEICGYGGPTNQLRTFAGKRIASSYPLSVSASVVSGDSGGPMLSNGCLVGVTWGAAGSSGNSGRIEGWPKTSPATSSVNASTLITTCQGVFRRWDCRPTVCDPATGCDSPAAIVPPTLIDNLPASEGPQGPQGLPGKDAVIDYDKLASEVVKRLPPFYPQWIDREGNVIDELKDGVRLGQTFPMRAEVISDDKK
tara:strand:- start:31 stop:1287 length:1257 start_codon:yes stop_codon:yes gene_type:complete